MRTIAVTGAASGMGLETATRLRAVGDRVISIDLRDADVVADLSVADGRAGAAVAVLDECDGRLDGAVMAAGLGPLPGAEADIAAVNFWGVTELLGAWRPALAATGNAKVVAFASNSAMVTPMIPDYAIEAFLGDAPQALEALKAEFGEFAPAMVYGSSKLALSRWLRRTATTAEWAGAGIRLNALAPGPILTPLLQAQLDGPNGDSVRSLPTPLGGFGDPGQIADWVVMMLSPAADFMCGSVVVVDGGSDAYFRSDDWPVPLSLDAFTARFVSAR